MIINWLDEFCLRLFITLLHFIWQGAAIGIIACVLHRYLRRQSASLRYSLNVTLLVCMPICCLATFPIVQVPAVDQTVDNLNGQSAPHAFASRAHSIRQSDRHENLDLRRAEPQNNLGRNSDGTDGSVKASSHAFNHDSLKWRSPSTEYAFALLSLSAPWVIAAYMLGTGALLLRLAFLTCIGHQLRVTSRPITDPQLLEQSIIQSQKLGLRFVPVIAYCEHVAVPTVIGLLTPTILVPAACISGFAPAQLATIIAHELAHISRYDLVVNLIQNCVQSILFFHPAVWYVSRRISEDRELCCDDLVVATGHKPMHYVDALLRMAEVCMTNKPTQTISLAASGRDPSQFEKRVHRLIGTSSSVGMQPIRGELALFVALASIATATLVLFQHSAFAQNAPLNISDGGAETVQTEKAVDPQEINVPNLEFEQVIPEVPIDQQILRLPLKQQITSTRPPIWLRTLVDNPRRPEWYTGTGPIVVDDRRMIIGNNVIDIHLGVRIKVLPFVTEKFQPFFMRLSSDHKKLLVCGRAPFEPNDPTSQSITLIQVWDIDTSEQIGSTIVVDSFPTISESTFDIQHDGATIVVGKRKLVGLWDLKSGKMVKHFPIQPLEIPNATAFSPDGNWLVVAIQNDLHFWKWQTDAEPRKVHAGRRILSLAFSPDSRYLAEGPDSRTTIDIRDMRTFEVAYSLRDEVDSPLLVRSLAFSGDGKALMAANSVMTDERKLRIPNRIHLWNIESEKILQQIPTPNHLPMRLDITPDGRYVAALVLGRKPELVSAVGIWDLAQLPTSDAVLGPHESK